jgi:hypothetical protein
VLRYARSIVGLTTLTLLGSIFLEPRFFPNLGREALGGTLQAYRMLLVIAGVLLTLLLQKLLHEFERPTPRRG